MPWLPLSNALTLGFRSLTQPISHSTISTGYEQNSVHGPPAVLQRVQFIHSSNHAGLTIHLREMAADMVARPPHEQRSRAPLGNALGAASRPLELHRTEETTRLFGIFWLILERRTVLGYALVMQRTTTTTTTTTTTATTNAVLETCRAVVKPCHIGSPAWLL